MSGIEIPGFEILEKVGAGGVATVWKARQVSLDRIVAIKILYSKFAADPADIQRFQVEAQSAAKLKHPGLVQVYDANNIAGMYYFVMEYVAGYTVGEWRRRKGVLAVKDAMLVAECVADALRYAWNSVGMIHCDIKPDNILIDTDGSVKVSDLGLSRTMSAMALDSLSDEVMGTPPYMAPEQTVVDGELDYRTDMYGLGATLYHLVTGEMPFEGVSMEAVMDMQVTHTIADPIEINSQVTAPVCWLIEKLMCKDPDGRPDSWDEVVYDIDRVKKGLRPSGEALPEGASTVERSTRRIKARMIEPSFLKGREKPSWTRIGIMLGLLGTAAVGAYYTLWPVRDELMAVMRGDGVTSPAPGSVAAPEPPETDWLQAYEQAWAWADSHPGQYDEAIRRYSELAGAATSTDVVARCREAIAYIRETKHAAVDEVMRSLRTHADALVADGLLDEAFGVYDDYAGDLADATITWRLAEADEIRLRIEEVARAEAAALALPELLDEVVDLLLSEDLQGALDRVEQGLYEASLTGMHDELQILHEELSGALAVRNGIFDSFRRQIGQEVVLHVRSGKKTFRIVGVEDCRVVARRIRAGGEAGGTMEFELNYLAYPERLKRMGSPDAEGGDLAMGLLALEARSFAYARKYFKRTHPLIADRLRDAVKAEAE